VLGAPDGQLHKLRGVAVQRGRQYVSDYVLRFAATVGDEKPRGGYGIWEVVWFTTGSP
jgi:hypothetical protein